MNNDPSSFEFPTGLYAVSYTKSLKDLRCQHEKAEIQEIVVVAVVRLLLDCQFTGNPLDPSQIVVERIKRNNRKNKRNISNVLHPCPPPQKKPPKVGQNHCEKCTLRTCLQM